MAALSSEYVLVQGPPTVDSYLSLRERTGMSPKTGVQAKAALSGGWAACHIVYESTNATVGMGRVIGDGGVFFQIVDLAVAPEHQRHGLGQAILSFLIEQIQEKAPTRAYVSLLADPPGRHLYERNGFAETAPLSLGMARHVP